MTMPDLMKASVVSNAGAILIPVISAFLKSLSPEWYIFKLWQKNIKTR